MPACALRAASSAASNWSSRATTCARKLAMVASFLTICSRASRYFLVACSSRVLPPLAIAFSTAAGNTSFNAVRTTAYNPGASYAITVPVSIAIGLARPGLPTHCMQGESVMTVLGARGKSLHGAPRRPL